MTQGSFWLARAESLKGFLTKKDQLIGQMISNEEDLSCEISRPRKRDRIMFVCQQSALKKVPIRALTTLQISPELQGNIHNSAKFKTLKNFGRLN
jgi:hypothetical protein